MYCRKKTEMFIILCCCTIFNCIEIKQKWPNFDKGVIVSKRQSTETELKKNYLYSYSFRKKSNK